MNSLFVFLLLLTYILEVSTFKRRHEIISLGDSTQNNPFQADINYEYMLTNPVTQMSQTPSSIDVSQTSEFPRLVGFNVATVLDESLMIQYTSASPLVTAFTTTGIVSHTNITSNSSVLMTELASPTTESVDLSPSTSIRLDNATPTIGTVTTGTTENSIAYNSSTITSNTRSEIMITTAPSDISVTTIIVDEQSTTNPDNSAASSPSTVTDALSSTNSSGMDDVIVDAPPISTLVPSTSASFSATMDKVTETSSPLMPMMTYLNTSAVGPIVGFVSPPEIRIYVNINPMPPISVNVANVVPTTSDDIIDVDIFEGNNTAIIRNDYLESTRETLSGTTINIDLSNQNIEFGQESSIPSVPPLSTSQPISSSISATTMAMPNEAAGMNRIYENKCNQYYHIGIRRARAAQVHFHIIGGTYSAQKEFPHMAALGYGKKKAAQWLCGGSLISEEYVITAAHCLSTKTLGDIQLVRLGTTSLQTETLESEDYDVIARIAHPGYVAGKQYNDIALLKLDRPVSFSDYIAPICLTDSKDFAHAKLVATGWGKMESGNISPDLKKVELIYVPRDVCQKGYEGISLKELPEGIQEISQFCAGSDGGSKDTCQGDSGGPLQMEQNGKMYLIGITSFGIGCGRIESPGVYTRVSYYIPWIEGIVWEQ